MACYDARKGAGSAPLYRLSAHDRPACALTFCTAVPGLLATASTDKQVHFVSFRFVSFPSFPFFSFRVISFHFISHLTVWGVEPIVTDQTSWLESTGVSALLLNVLC